MERPPVSPNMITSINLLLVITAGLFFASGEQFYMNAATLLYMCVSFLDHVDGELARAKHSESVIGYYFDWFTDTLSYSVMFISLAIGFHEKMGETGQLLVVFGVTACLLNTSINIHGEQAENCDINTGFPSFAGFSIDDGMYLIGPICWLGYLYPFKPWSAIPSMI